MPLDFNPLTTQQILLNGNTYRVTDFTTTTSINELPITTITLTPEVNQLDTAVDGDYLEYLTNRNTTQLEEIEESIENLKRNLKPMIAAIVEELLESKGFILGRIPDTIEEPPIE